MKKFEQINNVVKNILEENGIEKKDLNWAKIVTGWNGKNRNGYFFLGSFTTLYYPFQGNEVVVINFGREKLYLIFKIKGATYDVLYKEKNKYDRNWEKIEKVLKNSLEKNSLETKKEEEVLINIWAEIEKLPVDRLERLKSNISEKITELKKKEFEKKLSSYKDLGYENGWTEVPSVLRNNHFVIKERKISRIETQRWVDELQVKWHVDSSD